MYNYIIIFKMEQLLSVPGANLAGFSADGHIGMAQLQCTVTLCTLIFISALYLHTYASMITAYKINLEIKALQKVTPLYRKILSALVTSSFEIPYFFQYLSQHLIIIRNIYKVSQFCCTGTCMFGKAFMKVDCSAVSNFISELAKILLTFKFPDNFM